MPTRILALTAAMLLAARADGGDPEWVLPSAPSGHVNDFAAVLPDATRQSLEQLLAEHENKTGNQIVVVTLPTLAGRDIADVSFAIAERWQIGAKGRDNGVVFALAPHERRMRIEVGKGIEGELTDLQAHVILDELVKPAVAAGDFAGGVNNGTLAIVSALRGEAQSPAPPLLLPWWVLLIGGALMLILFIFFPRAGMLLLLMNGGRGRGGRGFSGGGGRFGGGGASGSW